MSQFATELKAILNKEMAEPEMLFLFLPFNF